MRPVWKIFAVTLSVCVLCIVTFVSLSESKKNDDAKKLDESVSASSHASTASKKNSDSKKSSEQVNAASAATVKSGQKFGEWTYLCAEKEDGGERCFLAQDRVVEGKGRALRVLLGHFGNKGEMVMKALTPLGIFIPAGVAYKIY